MKPVRTLNIFGEKVEILTDGAMTGGCSTTIIQTVPPGGGPPPHRHTREDETFTILEGNFELLEEGRWIKASVGEIFFAPRGGIHAFRNIGATTGRVLVFIAPSGIETFFEKLSGLNPASDMQQILAIFAEYGLSLQTP